MPASDPFDPPGSQAAWRFASTHWSVVLAAGQRQSSESGEALATLCRVYWYPLYAYARRRLPRPDDARDLTQEFFARLLEKEYLQDADPRRGKFRSFLLTAFKHFLAKERDRANAQKRGAGGSRSPSTSRPGKAGISWSPRTTRRRKPCTSAAGR